MLKRIISLIIGYGFGNFLTALAVSHLWCGEHIEKRGSGNPGVANVTRELGKTAGLLTLAGDLLKTIAAVKLAARFFGGRLARFYAGMGVVLGHDFPLWRHFRGGESVAATVMMLPMAAPLRSIAADLAGALVVATTGFLCLGAVAIPLCFALLSATIGSFEMAVLSLAMTLLMMQRHRRALLRVIRGEEKRHLQLLKK